ncbi:hypothetical protein BCR44DRAFT_46034, partial [Catenaria anguillulae PL171]
LVACLERQAAQSVAAIHHDRGTEFMNKSFDHWIGARHIARTTTTPATMSPQAGASTTGNFGCLAHVLDRCGDVVFVAFPLLGSIFKLLKKAFRSNLVKTQYRLFLAQGARQVLMPPFMNETRWYSAPFYASHTTETCVQHGNTIVLLHLLLEPGSVGIHNSPRIKSS